MSRDELCSQLETEILDHNIAIQILEHRIYNLRVSNECNEFISLVRECPMAFDEIEEDVRGIESFHIRPCFKSKDVLRENCRGYWSQNGYLGLDLPDDELFAFLRWLRKFVQFSEKHQRKYPGQYLTLQKARQYQMLAFSTKLYDDVLKVVFEFLI